MDILITFAIIASIILIGYFSELLFKKTGIPDVLILIVIGIVLRYGLGIITPENFGEGAGLFATFTLIYLLFQGALAIDFKTLFSSVKEATILTIISFFITLIVAGTLSIILFDFNISLALLFGTILGGISSAVVIPLVNILPLNKKYGSTLMLESAISDVLCIVGSMTMINILLSGQISGTEIFKGILSSFSLALILGAIIGLSWIFTLSKFKDLRRAHMVTIAIVIALYAFVESPLVEASGAIAALAFGLMLGNSKQILSLMHKTEEEKTKVITVLSKNAQSFFSEITFFVKVFFFVYLGILMDFSRPWIFGLATIVVLGIYLARPLTVKLAYRKQTLDDYSRTNLEILIPKGLAAAVLVNIVIQAGVEGADKLTLPTLAVILVSIVLTSILVISTSKGKFKGFWNLRTFKKSNAQNKESIKTNT